MITIHQQRFLQFGDAAQANFYVLVNPSIQKEISIDRGNSYRSCQVLIYDGEDLLEVIKRTEEPAHILVISPDYFITSVDQASLGLRKLAIMPLNSTVTSQEEIKHFIRIMEKTDSLAQREFADRLFDQLESVNALQIVDKRYGVSAEFLHQKDDYEWFEQGGPLEYGQQQMVPSGEVSVLPLAHGQHGTSQRLAINGKVALQGFSIVHTGKTGFCRDEQRNIYQALSTLENHAIIATIEDGVITHLEPKHPDVEPARLMLESLFAKDAKYRTIWELGMGINTQHDLWAGNAAMNEVHGGTYGVLHWGLGLTPYTQYHLDLLCPHTIVTGNIGDVESVLVGSKFLTNVSALTTIF